MAGIFNNNYALKKAQIAISSSSRSFFRAVKESSVTRLLHIRGIWRTDNALTRIPNPLKYHPFGFPDAPIFTCIHNTLV